MIKKYLLWLWIVFLVFLWFSDAKVQDVWLLKYPSTLDQNFSIWFIKGGWVLTDFLWSTKSVVALDTNTIFWWATNWMPYFYSEWVNTIQWFFDRYFSCDALTTIDTLPENCQLWWMIDYSWDLQSIKEIFKGFFSKVKQDDLAYYNYINNRYVGATLSYTEQWLEICWSSEEIWKSLCFRGWTCGASSSSHCNWFLGGWQLTNSQNLSNLSFWNVSNNWIWNAPWQVWYWNENYNPWEIENITWDVEQVPTNIDNYIEYYESRYGWDEWLCYVWTNDLTWAYWKPWVEFEYWSGATMFSLYSLMYWWFWNDKVSNVWQFLNCWFINYWQWFYEIPDERSYLCRYNWPDVNSVLYYDNLEFPFRNNRVAIYFLIDNLFNRMPEQSMGEHFVFYCAMKLNYDNYKNWSLDFNDLENEIDSNIKSRIQEYNNNYLSPQYWFSVPNMSWNDNIWWNLIQTWSWIPDDLNPSWLFKQFYDRINSLLQNFSPRVAFWFIPLWILYPMLFLVLFRILRH